MSFITHAFTPTSSRSSNRNPCWWTISERRCSRLVRSSVAANSAAALTSGSTAILAYHCSTASTLRRTAQVFFDSSSSMFSPLLGSAAPIRK